MQCVLGFAQKATAMHKLPLLWLFCFSENCKTPKVASLSVVDHHRLSGIITGHYEVVIDHPLSSRPNILCRSALNTAGRPNLPAESVLKAVEDRTWHGNVFQANVRTNISPIMFMTHRDTVLDSRTINRAFQCMMAQETKYAFWY